MNKWIPRIIAGLCVVIAILIAGMFALRGTLFNPVKIKEPTAEEIQAEEIDSQTKIFNERVQAYMKEHEDVDEAEARKRVAMHLDVPAYTQVTEIQDPNSMLVLVNKYAHFAQDYEPADLTLVTSSQEHANVAMRAEAAAAFEGLVNEAAQNGILLSACSAYRSYDDQEELYENGKAAYGLEYADTYWTRPGYSEHQSGLAVDIRLNNDLSDLDAVRWYPEDYQWLLDNMARYGFIIRYGDDKEVYTQIAPESWHLRYVGPELAAYLQENNLSLDEYYGLLALSQAQPF